MDKACCGIGRKFGKREVRAPWAGIQAPVSNDALWNEGEVETGKTQAALDRGMRSGMPRDFLRNLFRCGQVNTRHRSYKDVIMKVDVYKRPEQAGQFSYLAVPEGRPIPEEATAIDWETAENNVDLDENHQPVEGLAADDALQQISAKGYAISHVQNSKVRIGPSV